MASTRNNNTPGNYCLQQRSYHEASTYLTYKNGANGYAYDSRLPGNGLLAGQVPMPLLSRNAADIESFLWGVNATNLVEPQRTPFVPELTPPTESANLYTKETVWLPEPLAVQKGQRPLRR